MRRALWGLLLFTGCSGEEPVEDSVEPIEAPSDASEPGAPVGVRTVLYQDTRMEVWYPATDADGGRQTEKADFSELIPVSFTDHIGPVSLPEVDTGAIRDARLRDIGETYPVVIFSHGFGGFRQQSFDLTVHLASRGYVVIAPDHEGRMLSGLLPCLFSPVLDGCDATGTVDDPGPDDIRDAFAWVQQGDLAGDLDDSRVGLMGHSAGAQSIASVGTEDTRFQAVLMLGGADAVSRDVPAAVIDGSCDGVIEPSVTLNAALASTNAQHARIKDAGHQAFSDICALDLPALAAQYLEDRTDLNTPFYQLALGLAEDGCPTAVPDVTDVCSGSYLDLETAAEILRASATWFFDQHLRNSGDGLQPDEYVELTVTTGG